MTLFTEHDGLLTIAAARVRTLDYDMDDFREEFAVLRVAPGVYQIDDRLRRFMNHYFGREGGRRPAVFAICSGRKKSVDFRVAV